MKTAKKPYILGRKLTRYRVTWIDNLKTISILSIVMVHTGRISDIISTYFTSFFIPVFFFISGFLVKESIRELAFLDFVKIKFQRLIIPYITFSIFSYLIWFFIIGRFKDIVLPGQPLAHFFTNLIYGVGGYGWLEYNITLWFFPCLFITELIFFFLLRFSSRKILILSLFTLSILGYFFFEVVDPGKFRLPLGSDIALSAVVFYGIGYLLKPYLLNNNLKVLHQPLCFFFATLAYVIFSNLNQESAFVIGNFGKNYFYFYLSALSGILFWYQVSCFIKSNLLFEEISKNTLIIFPLHLLIFPFFTGVLVHIFNIPQSALDNSNIVGVTYTISAILLLVPFSWFLRRYTPFLLGVK